MTKEQFYDLFEGMYFLLYKWRDKAIYKCGNLLATIRIKCSGFLPNERTLEQLYYLGNYNVTVCNSESKQFNLQYENVMEL